MKNKRNPRLFVGYIFFLLDQLYFIKSTIRFGSNICFLSRVGSARDMQMNMIHVTSTPDLHYVKNMPATRLQVIRTTLLASVEVNYPFILIRSMFI